jgi:hypothetical protein
VALAPAPISSAAPGVDQAVTTGVRQRSDRPMQVMAMPRPSAHIHEPICSALAPIAAAPWNTITAETGEADQHRDETGHHGRG